MFKRHSAEFDKWELPQYYETEYTEIGVQLVDFPDVNFHPLYFRIYDTPGDWAVNYKAGEMIFQNTTVVLVVLDGARLPSREHTLALNYFAIHELRQFNTFTKLREKKTEFRQYFSKLINEPLSSGSLI